MSEYLDWVERAAVENFKLQHQTADILAKESATTLAVLLAGLGGGTAYAVRAVTGDAPTSVEWGAVAFTVHLLVLCFLLVQRCLKIQPIPSIFNEPKNLLGVRESHPDLSFDDIRGYELQNMQDGIQTAGVRNGKVAASLNKIRLVAVLSPIWFLLAFAYQWKGQALAAWAAACWAAGA